MRQFLAGKYSLNFIFEGKNVANLKSLEVHFVCPKGICLFTLLETPALSTENMASPLPADQLKNLKIFIDLLKMDSSFLHHPDLTFFKNYIESLGGVIPPKKNGDEPVHAPPPEQPEVEEVESEESEVELDYEGCIDPDNDPPQTMGYTKSEISEEDMEKSNEKKQAAMELFSEQKYEEAINTYTEAILLNPSSALLYAKRGQCYLQLKKPNACIRDCTRALEINPDNATAYKFRGRAHRLLGNFLKAAEDLRNACKIDFDEQADAWLKEVTPNARKLEEHQRKYERKRLEKEVKETRDRIKRMREEQQKRSAEMKENRFEFGDDGAEDPSKVSMEDLLDFAKNQEVLQAMKDPEIEAALQDICQNPANILKYQNNPKVNSFLMKFSKYANKMRGHGFQMPTDLKNFSGLFGGANDEGPKKAPPSSDIDLD